MTEYIDNDEDVKSNYCGTSQGNSYNRQKYLSDTKYSSMNSPSKISKDKYHYESDTNTGSNKPFIGYIPNNNHNGAHTDDDYSSVNNEIFTNQKFKNLKNDQISNLTNSSHKQPRKIPPPATYINQNQQNQLQNYNRNNSNNNKKIFFENQNFTPSNDNNNDNLLDENLSKHYMIVGENIDDINTFNSINDFQPNSVRANNNPGNRGPSNNGHKSLNNMLKSGNKYLAQQQQQ